jgi:hypothetical protein
VIIEELISREQLLEFSQLWDLGDNGKLVVNRWMYVHPWRTLHERIDEEKVSERCDGDAKIYIARNNLYTDLYVIMYGTYICLLSYEGSIRFSMKCTVGVPTSLDWTEPDHTRLL